MRDVFTSLKQSLILHVIIGYVFMASGLIVCALMLITYLTTWWWNRRLYRRIVTNLAYSNWSILTFVSQWYAGSEVQIYYEKREDEALIGKENTIAIMNHKYDIDWLMAWNMSERYGMLGGTKIYGKSSLRWIPIIGWIWMFTENIFLKRAWDSDKVSLVNDLSYLCDYPKDCPVTILLFCEGTRFTERKHAASMEIAKQKGLPLLKHHLLPRTRGFVLSMNALKGKFDAILDVNIGFDNKMAPPHFMNIVRGEVVKADFYVRRIPLSEVPTDSDEACAAWLHKLYKEKDDIYDDYLKNGCKFTKGVRLTPPRRCRDLVVFICWTMLLASPLFYYGFTAFISGSMALRMMLLLVTTLFVFGVRQIISVTEIKKGSTYGKTD